MAENEKYQTTLEGPQIDDALEQMNLRIPEGWAVGTRDGEDVPSTSQFYHNNAKYYAARAQAYSPIYMNVTSGTNARTIYDSAMMAYSNNGNMMIRVLVTDEGQSNYVWLRLLRRTNASNGNYRFDFAGVISPGVAPSPESGERKIVAFSVQRGGNDYIKYGPVIYTVPTKDYVDTVFQNMSAAIDLKAPLASPHLTGTPTTPTATAGDNSTQIANTAFVQGELNEVATELSIAINGKANKSDLARTEGEALSAFVTEEATPADIVTFTDGASNIHVKSFVGSIIPQQNLNGQSAPYPAGGGKNKVEGTVRAATTSNGITSQVYANNRLTMSGTATGNGDAYFIFTSPLTLMSGSSYTVSWSGTDNRSRGMNVFLYTGSSFPMYVTAGTDAHSATFTPSSDITITGIMFRMTVGGTVTAFDCNIQLEVGSTATDYAPYANVCPISGWTGAEVNRTGENLFNAVLNRAINMSTGAVVTGANTDWITDKIRIGDVKEVTLSIVDKSSMTNGSINLAKYDKNGGFLGYSRIAYFSSATTVFTTNLADDVAAIRYFGYQSGGAQGITSAKIQVEYGSTATAYEPYNGSTILLDFGQTVYAGTLTALGGGLWQVQPTHAIVDMGSLTWQYSGGSQIFYSQTISGLYDPSAPLYCSMFHSVSPASDNGSAYNKGNCTTCLRSGTTDRVYVRDDAYTDAAAFKTAVTGQTLCYPLATLPDPIIVSASDLQTLLGANTVWTDIGSVNSLEYRADTKLYIQKLLNGGTRTLAAAPLNRTSILMEPEATPEEVPEEEE